MKPSIPRVGRLALHCTEENPDEAAAFDDKTDPPYWWATA